MQTPALVFDLDGTLVDSLPDLRAGLNEMLRGLTRRELSAHEVRRMIGDGTHALVERALRATGELIDVERAHQRFRFLRSGAHATERLYPGIAATLRSLIESGARLGICTNKQQTATLAVLKGFEIAEYFEVIIGGDVLSFRKPNVRHLLTALEQLRISPNESVMIGDNENDYVAARAAGVAVILMRYGYLRMPPETLAPDAWLDRFADIPPALDRIKK